MLLEIFSDNLCSKSPSPDILCFAKCYFSKLRYQLLLVQYFWKKLKNINVKFFSHFWPLRCRTFLRMDHLCYIGKFNVEQNKIRPYPRQHVQRFNLKRAFRPFAVFNSAILPSQHWVTEKQTKNIQLWQYI